MNDLVDPSSPDIVDSGALPPASDTSDALPYYISPRAHSLQKRPRLTAQEAIDALVDARGNISLAARHLSRNRAYFKVFIDRTPSVLHCLATLRETLLDTAEHNFARAVENGHLESSKFILQTFGKDRGYLRPGVTASASDSSGNKVTFTIEG